MTLEQGDLILEILKTIQADMSLMKREMASMGVRLAAIEDHQRGKSDITDLKVRVDRIERRLGLTDTEH